SSTGPFFDVMLSVLGSIPARIGRTPGTTPIKLSLFRSSKVPARGAPRVTDPPNGSTRTGRVANAGPVVRCVRLGAGARRATGGPEGLDDLVVLETGEAAHPGVLGGLTDVDRDHHAVAAVGEELLGDRVGIEAGHRARGQAGGTDADDRVADLQARGELGRLGPGPLVVGEQIPGPGEVREDLGELVVEVDIGGQQRDGRCGGRLVAVAVG